jgi:hypothetical protein
MGVLALGTLQVRQLAQRRASLSTSSQSYLVSTNPKICFIAATA